MDDYFDWGQFIEGCAAITFWVLVFVFMSLDKSSSFLIGGGF